jgi:Ni,Fe-hydrogenase maturation factor
METLCLRADEGNGMMIADNCEARKEESIQVIDIHTRACGKKTVGSLY